ncbi:MAG: ABC transporter ATP-binding protein [Oscillospiraceae bacterium]|nr:ABC transporter ATP-binding protein [Oscillospiraceae bacterium]
MELLRIENLCKTYGKGENEVRALDNVSFTVPKGQMTAVVGPSGSGKSTLLHIIGGVDRPTSGKVWLDGQDVFAQNAKNLAVFRRRQVGLIYQFYNLIPVLNAEENITLPLIMDGRKPDKAQLEKLLDMLGLRERRDHLPSQLSGGQQQRVSIGRALFTSPGVILADEPTGNLDSRSSAEIIDLLRRSNREMNQTMLIITHDENIALKCDRIITISDGRITDDKLTGMGVSSNV